MAERGVNGASSATLNARFIKCAGCKVNVPKDDMIALGKCTVCGRVYEPVALADGDVIAVEFVAFSEGSDAKKPSGPSAAVAAAVETAAPARKRRWVALQSRKGRTYYHNTETGEDCWDKPADIDAEAADDAFGECISLPFKNDFVKKAVMLEQAKLEATKLGVPIELVTAAHQGQTQAEDPLSQMTKQALGKAEGGASAKKQTTATSSKPTAVEEEQQEEYEEFDGDDGRGDEGTAAAQDSEAKDGKCLVM